MAGGTAICTTAKWKPESSELPARIRMYTAPLARTHAENADISEVPSAAGCLRGLGWGLALEGAAAVVIYGIWRLALILR
jgi:hypothetical protein